MLTILGRLTSGNVQKVVFFVEEAKLPYRREDYGRQFGNTASETYIKMNPNGKVPTLLDGETVIWESNTILRYLASKYRPEMTGASPEDRSQVERWMDWLLASVNAPYLQIFQGLKRAAAERGAEFEAAVKELGAMLQILDRHLVAKEFIALGRPTIADIALAPIIKRCAEFDIERKDTPDVSRWLQVIEQRPSFKVALGTAPSSLSTAA